MHVSNHFKHFALQPNTATQTRAARKKAVEGEETRRVESRFGEDGEQENLRRGNRWGGASRQPERVGSKQEASSSTAGPCEPAPNVAALAPHVSSASGGSPLEAALASLINDAARPSPSVPAPKERANAAHASVDELLSLMRGATSKA